MQRFVQIYLHVTNDVLFIYFCILDSVLNYSGTDGNINILPLLKRIVQNHVPVWVFR